MKIWQEFYCNECIGYFRVKLDTSINERIVMICPNCGHNHHRYIKDGHIVEYGDGTGREAVEVIVPKSAYSKEPFNKASRVNQRAGSVIDPESIDFQHQAARAISKERFAELYGGRA